MKKLLNIAMIMALMLQCNSFIAADPSQLSYRDRFANWLQSIVPGGLVAQEKQKIRSERQNFAQAAIGLPTIGSVIGTGIAAYALNPTEKELRTILLTGGILFESIIWVALIKSTIQIVRQRGLAREQAVQQVKNTLLSFIMNSLLFPTRSSRINALLKKDEFLQYIRDEDNIVADACKQLIEQMNPIPPTIKSAGKEYRVQFLKYKQEMAAIETIEKNDEKINNEMRKIETQIWHLPLQERVDFLQKMKDSEEKFTIPQAQAWLSVYYRLQNKIEVEKKLSDEEKASRGAWQEAAQKAYKETPVEKQQMSKEDQEKYRKEYLKKRQAALQKRQGKMLEGTPKLPGIMTEEEVKAYEIEGEELKKKAREAEEELKRKREARSATVQ